MKLALRRSQQDVKGMLGGHKGVNFVLNARAIFTPDEERLIQRYGMDTLLVHQWVADKKNETTRNVTIGGLRGGTTVTLTNLGELLEAEEQIKSGCGTLKMYLEKAATFGGEEIIDI